MLDEVRQETTQLRREHDEQHSRVTTIIVLCQEEGLQDLDIGLLELCGTIEI